MNITDTFLQVSTGAQRLAQTYNYDSLPKPAASETAIQALLTIAFTITGAIAVMMVVIGGIKYAASQGDSQAVSKAKNTIIYAIVGLILSISAVGIVSFVFGRVA